VPALVLAFCRIKRGTFFIACLCLTTLILIWLLPDNATIAGQTLEGLDLYYRPESWHSIYEALLVQDNWHLLGYISIALVMLVLTAARSSLPPLAPLAGVVFSAFCMFLVLYLFTRHSHGALHFTSINRVALQLIPTIAFFTMLLYLRLYKEDAV
jgi:hypothetical protein